MTSNTDQLGCICDDCPCTEYEDCSEEPICECCSIEHIYGQLIT